MDYSSLCLQIMSHGHSFGMTHAGSQGTQMGIIRNIVTHFMAKRATFLGSHEYHKNALCDLETEIKGKDTPWDGRPLLMH